MRCHFLLQRIFPIQGSNPCLLHLLHWQADSLALHDVGNPIYKYLFTYKYTIIYINKMYNYYVEGWLDLYLALMSSTWTALRRVTGTQIPVQPPKLATQRWNGPPLNAQWTHYYCTSHKGTLTIRWIIYWNDLSGGYFTTEQNYHTVYTIFTYILVLTPFLKPEAQAQAEF